MGAKVKEMAITTDQTHFVVLPTALVEDVLNQTETVAEDLLTHLRESTQNRESLRQKLARSGTVTSESSLGYPPLPTTCGTDGSYAIERLLTTDLAVAAAVAVEGLAPPSEKRHWEHPHHKTFIAAEPHLEDTATVLRAVMLGEELLLAASAPHDVVMLDGTLTLPVIYFNQALNKAPETQRCLPYSNRVRSCSVVMRIPQLSSFEKCEPLYFQLKR